jgi:hypothetical protein
LFGCNFLPVFPFGIDLYNKILIIEFFLEETVVIRRYVGEEENSW